MQKEDLIARWNAQEMTSDTDSEHLRRLPLYAKCGLKQENLPTFLEEELPNNEERMTPEQLREEPNIGAAPGLGVPDFPPPEAPEPEQEPEPEPRPATPPPLAPRGQRQLTPPPVPPRPQAQARERDREDSPPPALQPRADGIPQDIGWIHQFRNARRDHQETGNETIFSTSPTSSSTTSPPIHLDSLTIAIMVVPGLIIFVLFSIVLSVCLL
ncbi:unnamed protein product [Caenorhabditis nigoni]